MPDNTHPLVTIAIPTYNRADSYLKVALQCAIDQTYRHIEIIVSDNCSTDHTEKVVKSFPDNRIRYFKQAENIGSNNNCNFCLEQARGEYFMLLFDDDVIDRDFIEACVDAMPQNRKVGVILTGAREIDEYGRTRGECQNRAKGSSIEEFFLDWFANNTPLYLCSTLYYTHGLREIGGFYSKTNRYQDVVATAKLMAKYRRADVPAVKAGFRRHSANLGSSVDITSWCEDSLYLLRVLCALNPSANSLLERRGMAYFCKSNFRRASRIKHWPKRMMAYWAVSQRLNHSYSLTRFLYDKNIRPRVRACTRKMQQFIPGIWKPVG